MAYRTRIGASFMCSTRAVRRGSRQATKYVAAANERIDNDETGLSKAGMFRPDTETLIKKGAIVIVVEDDGKVMGGCYLALQSKGHVEICGLFKTFEAPGVVAQIAVAFGVVEAYHIFPDTPLIATIRVYPQGWKDGTGKMRDYNRASAKLFKHLGFEKHGKIMSHDWIDAVWSTDLKASLELNGTFKNFAMIATPTSLALAKEILASHGFDTREACHAV